MAVSGPIPFIVLAVISLGWLFWALHRYRAFSEAESPDAMPAAAG